MKNTATAGGKDPEDKDPEEKPGTTEDPVQKDVTLIIHYWFVEEGGEKAADDYRRPYKVGSSYNVASPVIRGYSADHVRVTGTITKDLELNVIYTRNVYTLTIRYRYTTGGDAAPTHTEELYYGGEYSVRSPIIDGYTVSRAVVRGRMPAYDMEITVYYDAGRTGLVTIDDFDTPLGLSNVNLNAGEAIE